MTPQNALAGHRTPHFGRFTLEHLLTNDRIPNFEAHLKFSTSHFDFFLLYFLTSLFFLQLTSIKIVK